MDSGKKSFLWLVAVFVTPVLLGTLLFFNMERLGFERGSVNYGTLIQPAVPLKLDGLKQQKDAAKPEETIRKKWTLLYINLSDCNKACQDRLLLIKRVRLLTNEKMRRVRTVMVTDNESLKATLANDYPDLVMTNIESNSPFIQQFPEKQKNPVYLIDPLGNLMMYYDDVEPNAKKMIKDLHRLLKYSHLG